MDAELKARWVKALRSGEYQQCQETLHDGAGYCCLGVLANICNLSNIPETIDGYAPLWALVGGESVGRALSERNDGEDVWRDNPQTFAQIADYIEEHL